jgi:HPt (histidine-containing phosphotransfer) domain-containing protein
MSAADDFAAVPLLDQSVLKSLHTLLGEEMEAVLTVCLEELGQQIAGLDEALHATAAESLVEAAHSLKGSAGNLGGARLAALAQTLEHAARNGSTAPLSDAPAVLRDCGAATLEALRQWSPEQH